MSEKLNIFYTTCGNVVNSRKLARKLASSKKIICVNIIKNVESYYENEDKINIEDENVLIIKTFLCIKDLKSILFKFHPYETPFLTQLENLEVNNEYLEWAKKNI